MQYKDNNQLLNFQNYDCKCQQMINELLTQTLLVAGDANFTNVLTVKLMTAKNPEDERNPQVHLYLDPGKLEVPFLYQN